MHTVFLIDVLKKIIIMMKYKIIWAQSTVEITHRGVET